jgi:hypothetical protein
LPVAVRWATMVSIAIIGAGIIENARLTRKSAMSQVMEIPPFIASVQNDVLAFRFDRDSLEHGYEYPPNLETLIKDAVSQPEDLRADVTCASIWRNCPRSVRNNSGRCSRYARRAVRTKKCECSTCGRTCASCCKSPSWAISSIGIEPTKILTGGSAADAFRCVTMRRAVMIRWDLWCAGTHGVSGLSTAFNFPMVSVASSSAFPNPVSAPRAAADSCASA